MTVFTTGPTLPPFQVPLQQGRTPHSAGAETTPAPSCRDGLPERCKQREPSPPLFSGTLPKRILRRKAAPKQGPLPVYGSFCAAPSLPAHAPHSCLFITAWATFLIFFS
eukprot:TRINITY_DN1301_c4_g1_i1.p2 TRINITY_DN1301_c4_g1~~TRINITY_DN1301_c4_g1_i1.p2  ORF type:complete len:109 (-),score=16.21 TRINITY_DN1301_c4_g1_i1:75-401(-)